MVETYVGKSEQTLSKVVIRVLGVARGDRKRIMKVLEREEEKDVIAAVRRRGASCTCPLFWGRDRYDGFKAKKLDWSHGVHFA